MGGEYFHIIVRIELPISDSGILGANICSQAAVVLVEAATRMVSTMVEAQQKSTTTGYHWETRDGVGMKFIPFLLR